MLMDIELYINLQYTSTRIMKMIRKYLAEYIFIVFGLFILYKFMSDHEYSTAIRKAVSFGFGILLVSFLADMGWKLIDKLRGK